jgi:hypothetical protein
MEAQQQQQQQRNRSHGGHMQPTLAGGGGAQLAAEIFRKHDLDASNALGPQEMVMALQELGVLEGLKARAAGGRPGWLTCWAGLGLAELLGWAGCLGCCCGSAASAGGLQLGGQPGCAVAAAQASLLGPARRTALGCQGQVLGLRS